MFQANNWVIYSVVKNARLHARIDEKSPANQQQIPHIITTNLEHDSVKLVLENLEKEQTAGEFVVRFSSCLLFHLKNETSSPLDTHTSSET